MRRTNRKCGMSINLRVTNERGGWEQAEHVVTLVVSGTELQENRVRIVE